LRDCTAAGEEVFMPLTKKNLTPGAIKDKAATLSIKQNSLSAQKPKKRRK